MVRHFAAHVLRYWSYRAFRCGTCCAICYGMIHFQLDATGKVVAVSGQSLDFTLDALQHADGWQNRNDWKSYAEVEHIASSATEHSGETYTAVDNGPHHYPRFDVVRAPKVGDEVSYTFNGDYYPDGKIVSVSTSLKVVRTDSGRAYYRRKLTGIWLHGGMWALVPGHIDRRNPSF